LHPVVRGVAAGRMGEAETGTIGSHVVDHFSNSPHDPFEQAESLDDLAPGIQVVATLTRMGKLDAALSAYQFDLSAPLRNNLMAHGDIQRLLHPFFPEGWAGPLAVSDKSDEAFLLREAGIALYFSDMNTSKSLFERSLRKSVERERDLSTMYDLMALSAWFGISGKLAEAARLKALTLEFAEAAGNNYTRFRSLLSMYWAESYRGAAQQADTLWARLDPKKIDSGNTFRPGGLERPRAVDLFWRGALSEHDLSETERLCRQGRDRFELVECLLLCGSWQLSRGEPHLAIEPLDEAVRLVRLAGVDHREIEVLHGLAHLRTGHPAYPRVVAEQLDTEFDRRVSLVVAEIWRELDEPERATAAALRAHKSSCGSGEPYVYRYHLDRADALLRDLGETPPEVPQHDPAKDEVFDWEDDVRALIEKTRKEREELERKKAEREKKKPEE
jgi:hypothetical protein